MRLLNHHTQNALGATLNNLRSISSAETPASATARG